MSPLKEISNEQKSSLTLSNQLRECENFLTAGSKKELTEIKMVKRDFSLLSNNENSVVFTTT
jgi:hypothetical protein